ncbi:DUF928 domain-containing protein [Pedobacter sp. PWIIR3]
MLYKNIIIAILTLISVSASAQLSVQFIPEVYGRSIDGLVNASIINTSGSMSVRLSITVTEDKLGKVVTLLTRAFSINKGNNVIPANAIKSSTIQLSNNASARFLQKNGYFPQGNYEYNFQVISAISTEEILIDQIFNSEVLPPAPLDLIEPYNEEKICNKKPVLTWQPSIPTAVGTMYELLLVEIKDRQTPVEALNYNLPVVKQKGINNPILLYPPSAKELITGKSYAWQVTAYIDQTIINRSEIWEFTVNCEEEESPVEDDNGYRDIEDLFRGNFYVANGYVKFTLVNSYNEQPLNYSISCVTDPGIRIRQLPKVKLKKGKNRVQLDFSRNLSFRDGYSYLLDLKLPNGPSKKLRFIYKDLK